LRLFRALAAVAIGGAHPLPLLSPFSSPSLSLFSRLQHAASNNNLNNFI